MSGDAGSTETPEDMEAIGRDERSLGDQQRGLYRKFIVQRADGSGGPGGKHEFCTYFVLDLQHDRHAVPALLAYAESCKDGFPTLSAALRMMLGSLEPRAAGTVAPGTGEGGAGVRDDGTDGSAIFELGRTYRHTTGKVLRIVARAGSTTYSGPCLIAEDQSTGDLIAVGESADSSSNWTDVTPDPATSVKRYRARPAVVEAIRWDGTNWGAVCAFLGVPEHAHGDMATLEHTDDVQRMDIIIHTPAGDMRAGLGDYIVKGVNGGFCPSGDDLFRATYEPVMIDA